MPKTIKISIIQDEINRLLSLDNIDEQTKITLCNFIEKILMDTKNYKGFNHIDWSNGGFDQWEKDGEPGFPEKSKYLSREYSRVYYKSEKLI